MLFNHTVAEILREEVKGMRRVTGQIFCWQLTSATVLESIIEVRS